MKKAKAAILLLLTLAATAGLVPFALSDSDTDVLSGGNADLSYVYTENDGMEDNVTAEASDRDNDAFEAFDDNKDTAYLYMGADAEFDKVLFDIEDGMKFEDEDEGSIKWEYNDGDSWRNLSVESDTTEDFGKVGTKSVTFNLPGDWEKSEYENHSAYWVRASTRDDTEDGVKIEQMSVRVYNVSVTVKNDKGDHFTDLSKSNFDISNPIDDTIYGFEQEDSDTYLLALQTETSNNDYTITVSVDGYTDMAVKVTNLDTDMQHVSTSIENTVGCVSPFIDLDYHWAQTAINNLYCRGILNGDTNAFQVNHSVTRAEFLKMALLNADANTGKYATYDVPYGDVSEDDWEYAYVATAYQMDIIDGAGQFYPNAYITRVEALVILVRLAGINSDKTATRFSDVTGDDWFAGYVRAATDYSVVEGYPDGTFQPSRNVSRGEAAVMVDNAYSAWYDGK
ncbi:MAG: S-layer homology domain-containing protein [Candidatus Gracilibacteria bacterium]|jgi:hypothetical protein